MADAGRTFHQLTVEHWRQFQRVEVEFHPKLTVITGANGAGKTTLLNVLSRHFDWRVPFVSAPLARRRGLLSYVTGLWPSRNQVNSVGELVYSDGGSSPLVVPDQVGESFDVTIQGQQTVVGLYVPSHRPVFVYQKVNQIPTERPTPAEVFGTYSNELRTRFMGGYSDRSPSTRMKESLIGLAAFGYGNEVIAKDEEAVVIFEGFQRVLRTVLPPSLQFRKLSIRMPEVVFETGTGTFSFDAVSGGVSAILDLAWQVYMRALDEPGLVVCIDEPENHLHPSLQRRLLPSFLKAFPQVQFIVSTHNPFIVGSVPDSSVYALKYVPPEKRQERNHSVVSERLDLTERAGTANQILRDVLDLPSTRPVWAERELRAIVDRYASRTLDDGALQDLRHDLAQFGLADLYPESLEGVISAQDDSSH